MVKTIMDRAEAGKASAFAMEKSRAERYQRDVEAGVLSKEDYAAWMRGQVFQSEAWAHKRGQLARLMADVDAQAQRMVNEGKLEVFAENANFMNFKIERETGATATFGLYNAEAVKRMIRDDPNMLPMPKIDKEKSYSWYNRIIQNCVTQAILQGESLEEIAHRVSEETGEKALKTLLRNARTAYTGAQNAGALEAARVAKEEYGLVMQKQWMATLDSHTRDSHAYLDGQIRDLDEPFESLLGPIMYPGDPDAEPGDVYNCRCTMVEFYPRHSGAIPHTEAETGERFTGSYREWKAMKAAEAPERADTEGAGERFAQWLREDDQGAGRQTESSRGQTESSREQATDSRSALQASLDRLAEQERDPQKAEEEVLERLQQVREEMASRGTQKAQNGQRAEQNTHETVQNVEDVAQRQRATGADALTGNGLDDRIQGERRDWSQATFQTESKFARHVDLHMSEFGYKTPEEYLVGARLLLNAEISDEIEGFTGRDGFVFRYDTVNNALAIGHPGESISTYFKPENGRQYWDEQVDLYKPQMRGMWARRGTL